MRLSQCMIVKNEEKNISNALAWGKGIVDEQIVVDTGSTDHTVELAQKLGARVYHFKWIDDFSAAKNYAIEQANGDWIAFLDADEYFTEKDAVKLRKILEKLDNVQTPTSSPQIEAVNCGWIHLDDDGKPFSKSVQTRIFRNKKGLRYHNKIHEQIQKDDFNKVVVLDLQKELSIFHTGYSSSEYQRTDKLERNIELLQKYLDENPEDYNYWSYLGDSLKVKHRYDEAAAIYKLVLEHSSSVTIKERLSSAAYNLLQILIDRKDTTEEENVLKIVRLVYEHDRNINPDIIFQAGIWMFHRKQWIKALAYFEEALAKLDTYIDIDIVYMAGKLETVYYLTATAAQEAGFQQKAVNYCVKGLRACPHSERLLMPLLSMLKQDTNSPTAQVLKFLTDIYHMEELKEKLFVYKCAKSVSYFELEDLIFDSMSSDEKQWFQKKERNPYTLDNKDLKVHYPSFACRNQLDIDFITLMEEIRLSTMEQLLYKIKAAVLQMKKDSSDSYQKFINYYMTFNYWGSLSPENEDYTTLVKRAEVLKEHREDFIWLYLRLEDYRSKKTLFAILKNWMHLDTQLLAQVKENGEQYFDLDILPSCERKVFVDLGAYTGDTLLSFLKIYGSNYQHFHCYEMSKEAAGILERNAKGYPNITIHKKAIGSEHKYLFMQQASDLSANHLTEDNTSVPIEIVTLDEDISEHVSIIKMDIEGAEQDALKGAVRHIQGEHPTLIVCTYHGYEDIWRIPRTISEISPDYRFYMRHYGGNLIPTEFVLFAV